MGQWLSWHWDADLTILLPLAWLFYFVCWIWLRRKGSEAATISRLCYWTLGAVVVSVATMSAIDILAGTIFSVHMLQHVLLIDLAPPLALLARPFSIIQALFQRKSFRTGINSNTVIKGVGRLLSPSAAWGISTVTLLVWHIPSIYDYALAHPAVHDYGEHVTLFIAFLIWWHPLIGSLPEFSYLAGSESRFFYLVAGMVPVAFLGILILFSPQVIYTYYLHTPDPAGFSSMVDQQLGAVVMLASGMLVLATFGLPLQYKESFSLAYP